ncbi:MAG: endonuclease NucS domain-containing protein [Candidatus Ozemobacteraceae bacterium]
MSEFRKILSDQEIETGILHWSAAQDEELRRVLPATLMFDLLWEGKRIEHLTIAWENRELHLGEPLTHATAGLEIVLSSQLDKGGNVVSVHVQELGEAVVIRKRLSLSEFKARSLKWFAREDELYRRLFPPCDAFSVQINGKSVPNRRPDYDKRALVIGEALRVFEPGDNLLIHRDSSQEENPVLVISREEHRANAGAEEMTSLRSLVTRLISRPLCEFNEGEIKGLIAMLDENKNLWERLSATKDENERMKEQIATLENVFEQFAKNTFFTCKRDFEEWVVTHLSIFEKGMRLLHRDYAVTWEGGRKRRIDLLCQDRKGVLVAIEVVFNPTNDDLENIPLMVQWLRQNVESLGRELTEGRLQARSIRGIVVSNREKPELVETCLEGGMKLCVVNGGFVVDTLE